MQENDGQSGCHDRPVRIRSVPQECDAFDQDVYDAIALETCLNGRISEGGPSAAAVEDQLKAAKAAIEELTV